MGHKDKFYSFHKSLTFDDVLIQPTEVSHIQSRLDTDLTSKITRNHTIPVPLISSPMDRVTEYSVACEMAKQGAAACFHRFQTVKNQLFEVEIFNRFKLQNKYKKIPTLAAVSAQIEDPIEHERIDVMSKHSDILIIDTAMGTNIKVLKAIEYIKNKFPNVDIIAGNVVTPEGCETLIRAGVDGIRAGIGNGSGCLTRIQTGVGRGQLTVLIECSDVCSQNGISLISDGGHSTPGDVAKALAAGADCIMMGSPLAGHYESPGDILYKYEGHLFKAEDQIFIPGVGLRYAKDIDGLQLYKEYRGMASKEAQVDWRGKIKPGTTHEGIQKHIKVKGAIKNTISNIVGGIRSSLSYCNATTIREFQNNAKFEKLSLGAQKESYER